MKSASSKFFIKVLEDSSTPLHELMKVGPSERKSASARHPDSYVYGDDFISPREELKYPNPREERPMFSTRAGAKGPLFNHNVQFFRASPYDGPRISESPHFWTK